MLISNALDGSAGPGIYGIVCTTDFIGYAEQNIKLGGVNEVQSDEEASQEFKEESQRGGNYGDEH